MSDSLHDTSTVGVRRQVSVDAVVALSTLDLLGNARARSAPPQLVALNVTSTADIVSDITLRILGCTYAKTMQMPQSKLLKPHMTVLISTFS